MNILHVFKTFYPESYGGIEYVAQVLCEQHAGVADCRVLALTSRHENYVADYGYQVYFYKKSLEVASTGFSWSLLKHFYRHAEWADVIHFHYPWPFADVCNLFYRGNKARLVTYHSDIVKQRILSKIYAPLERQFLNSMDCIVATSPNYAKHSENLRHVEADRLRIIPIGIEECPHTWNENNISDRILSLSGRRFFLFLGVLRYYKGLSYLLQAASQVSATIVIAGDGPERETLLKQASELNLTNVHFVGKVNQDEKVFLLRHASAFLFPSNLRTEAFGISLLEASACSLPMVTCEIGSGNSFVNQHEQTGLVVPPNSPSALASAIDKLWHNEMLAVDYGVAAYQRFQRLFTARHMAEQYMALYRNLLHSQ